MTFVEAMTAFSGSAIARELLGATADLFENVLRPELEEVSRTPRIGNVVVICRCFSA